MTGPRTSNIEVHLPCIQCSYELRALPVDGNCPECGTPVERSLTGELLEHSAPEYIASLRRGLTIVLYAAICQVLIGVAAQVLAVSAFRFSPIVLGWAGVASSLIGIVGWWIFSVPDPDLRVGNTGANTRTVLRVCAIICAAGIVIATVLEQVVDMLPSEAAIDLPAWAASIVLFAASLPYVRWLVRRVPDGKLDQDGRAYLWKLPLIFVLGSCVVIGPVAAIIIYLLYLSRVREHLRLIAMARGA